jgi:hypothetical protein
VKKWWWWVVLVLNLFIRCDGGVDDEAVMIF